MLQFKDFPDLVAGVQAEVLTWDFDLPLGVKLTGNPDIEISVVPNTGADSSPETRIGEPTKGTAVYKDGRTGGDQCAIMVLFSGGAPNCKYLFTVSCNRSDDGVAAAFNHLYSVAPA